MSARVPYQAEIDRILEDLSAAFDGRVFETLYPDVPAPKSISVNGDSQHPMNEVIVWPFPQSVSNTHTVTCSSITTQFDLSVVCIAGGATVRMAARHMLTYAHLVHQAVLADPDLGGLVDHADPTILEGDVDQGKVNGFVAGAAVRIRCTRQIPLDKQIARLFRDKSQ